MWTPWSEPGLEHLLEQDSHVRVDNIVIGVSNRKPFRLHYQMMCDSIWRGKELSLALLSGEGKSIKIQADGQGHWYLWTSDPVSALKDCFDVDISATPFTNTLPIRRLALKPGQLAELLVAYVVIPEIELKSNRQRYTYLA